MRNGEILIFLVLLNSTRLGTPAAMLHPPELPMTLAFRSNNTPYQQFSRLRPDILSESNFSKATFSLTASQQAASVQSGSLYFFVG